MPRTTLGSCLAEARERRGLTVAALAHRAHVSVSLLQRLEQDRLSIVTSRKLPAVARALAIELDDLLTEEVAAPTRAAWSGG